MVLKRLMQCSVHISDWAGNWQLPLSTAKCCWMRISNRSINTLDTFTLDRVVLKEANELKDLGVIFISKLSFVNHITTTVGKAKQRLFLLNKSFLSKDPKTLIMAYKTYVIPILDYCSPVWSPHSATDISPIESVQGLFTKRLID